MIANSIFAASVIMLAILLYVGGELTFLAPYRELILTRYSTIIVAFIALAFFNLSALFFVVSRKLLLKDTGRKLEHVETQLRTGSSISEELTKLLED